MTLEWLKRRWQCFALGHVEYFYQNRVYHRMCHNCGKQINYVRFPSWGDRRGKFKTIGFMPLDQLELLKINEALTGIVGVRHYNSRGAAKK